MLIGYTCTSYGKTGTGLYLTPHSHVRHVHHARVFTKPEIESHFY